MSIVSWLSWRSEHDKFADLVRDGLAETGHYRRIRYNKADFALHVEGAPIDDPQGTVWLLNLFVSFSQLSAAERPAALKRIVAFVTESRASVPASFGDAANRLLPSVRSMVEVGTWALQCNLEEELSKAKLPYRRVTEGLAAWLALDGSESIMRLSAEQIASWGVGFDEAFEVALNNLRAISAKPFVMIAPGLYRSDWSDGYDASRLLLTDVISSLPVRGMPVAMAPHRDVLLVTGADDEAGLEAMTGVGQSLLGGPRPLSALTFSLVGDTWRDFVPDPSRPEQKGLAELQEAQASIDYDVQKALLDARHAKTGDDIFVATHWLRRERETGGLLGSFGTWTEGADTLLPKAQSVVLVAADQQRVVSVPWERVVEIAGDLMVPMGWWPERFRVRSFPSGAQLAELEAAAEPLLDSQSSASSGPDYPRSYGISTFWKIIVLVVCAAVIAAGAAGIGYAILVELAAREASIVFVAAPAFMAIAAYAIADILKWRVTLEEDAVEVLSLRGVRRLRRSDIKGYRFRGARGSLRSIILVPADQAQKNLHLPLMMDLDSAFIPWFSALPDLDADDLRESVKEITANPAFGSTRADRMRRLTRAVQIALALNYAVILVTAWALLSPWPYGLSMASLGAFPLIALALVVFSRGLFMIDAPATYAHANVGTAFYLPGFVLMVRVLLDFNMVNWWPPIVAGAAVSVVLVSIAVAADRRMRRRRWVALVNMLLAGAYGFGATVEANALLDRSQPTVFRSAIIYKEISYGRAKRFKLRLAPWGPLDEPTEATVPKELYDKLETGGSACVLFRRGAFDMPWFIVLGCG
ncbi:MAG: DUF1444 family protein [Hyphomicrobium sp.]|jgi:uncharacterized protein YtpQ (UPF0354 family)